MALLPCRDQDSAAVVVGHMVSRHTLGAAQVHGHGLADRVRDGVLLRVFRGLCPCEHAVQVPAFRTDDSGCASPSVHRQSWTSPSCHSDRFPPRADCAEDRCDSSVQFFGKVVHLQVLCNDRCHG